MSGAGKTAVYRIERVIGNNFVCSKDDKGREIIIRGLGIGFRKQPGDLIPPQKIEKVYALPDAESSGKLRQLISEIPEQHIAVSTEIIEDSERMLGRGLSQNIYLTLTDHISFAIERFRKGIQYPNNLLWEIRNFYAAEYALGQHALDIIEQRLGIRLPEDEAGFIALHIVNAELESGMSDMVRITEFIRETLKVVEQYYAVQLDEQSIDYGRFITHLKFLGQRIFKKKTLAESKDTFWDEMVRKRYQQDYACALQIGEQVHKQFDLVLSGEELVFLTIHLHRLSGSTNDEADRSIHTTI